MARGYIFEIVDDENKGLLKTMDESDFYDMSGREFGYVEDVPEDERISLIHGLLDRLIDTYGFIAGEDNSGTPLLIASHKAKQNYFAEALKEVKKIVTSMSIELFSSNVDVLQYLIEDTDGDAVFYNGCFYRSFDYFVRKMVPNQKYYIGNVVLMH